jgi:micrococcal nuclease
MSTSRLVVTLSLTLLGLLLVQIAIAKLAAADTGLRLYGTVERLRDGDTLLVRPATGGRAIPIRLRGISAPELREPGGKEAKAFLERLTLGRSVVCDLTGEASHDRLVGYCALSLDLGDALLGAALVRRCPAFDPDGRYPEGNTTLPIPPYCGAKP